MTPVFESMEKTAIPSKPSIPKKVAYAKFPEGCSARDITSPGNPKGEPRISLNAPVAASIPNTDMLPWSKFAAYRNLPEG